MSFPWPPPDLGIGVPAPARPEFKNSVEVRPEKVSPGPRRRHARRVFFSCSTVACGFAFLLLLSLLLSLRFLVRLFCTFFCCVCVIICVRCCPLFLSLAFGFSCLFPFLPFFLSLFFYFFISLFLYFFISLFLYFFSLRLRSAACLLLLFPHSLRRLLRRAAKVVHHPPRDLRHRRGRCHQQFAERHHHRRLAVEILRLTVKHHLRK